ncbi:MAG: CDP-alcohol phosphatidyltransferase family protein [Chloroflexota bacterium]
MAEESKKHTRVNDILLGPLERPALQFFSKHTPAWASPDTMTIIGVIGAVLIAAGYILTRYQMAWLWLASFGLFVNWFGDSMDGTLARYRKIERPNYGYYVDHVVDVFNEFLVVIGLGLSPLVRFDVAAFTLIGYLMMAVHVFLRTYVDDVFKISYGKLGPTEVRVLIIIANTLVFFLGNPMFNVPLLAAPLSLFDLFVGFLGLLFLVFFLVSAYQYSRELARIGK